METDSRRENISNQIKFAIEELKEYALYGGTIWIGDCVRVLQRLREQIIEEMEEK